MMSICFNCLVHLYAKSCIIGLSDICCTACSDVPKTSVIQGICSAVCQNVLTFFISSFKGKDIFQIVGNEIVQLLDSADKFYELTVLFKLRFLSLFRIFFRYPKSLLAASFYLFNSTAPDGVQRGLYFLSQLTSHIHPEGTHQLDKNRNESRSSTCSIEMNIGGNEVISEELVSDSSNVAVDASPILKSCLLKLVQLFIKETRQTMLFSATMTKEGDKPCSMVTLLKSNALKSEDFVKKSRFRAVLCDTRNVCCRRQEDVFQRLYL